jgi:hypothetical protein
MTEIGAVGKVSIRGEHGPETIEFSVNDTGARETYSTGMVREPQDGAARFDLLHPLEVPYEKQLMTRFAVHMAKGAQKYTERNWEKAKTTAELVRFRASLLRHVAKWLAGARDEDHAAGIMFNLLAFETTAYKMHREGLATGFEAPLPPLR